METVVEEEGEEGGVEEEVSSVEGGCEGVDVEEMRPVVVHVICWV